MATELGQAYVQIMPSAKGIKGSIQKTLDPEASSAGKSAGSKIGTALKLGTAAAVAGLGVIIGKAISEGGNLEQSIGGVETLFKDHADVVQRHAANAYRTVGVSANDYMENVTSFSASLLQSMGGDTEEAAKVAHMAMVDMGDNANKMGTDMRDIQNAYQGFAKENYTMLDNLKLGYGGTKSEMERLLADAQKLTGVKYNIDNLDDVYMAINAIQQEIGITGTTALEAEETIQGSLAAMKASFANLLGNIAIGASIDENLQSLAQTISTFLFGNLLPMLGNIFSALPTVLVGFFQYAIPIIKEQGIALIESMGGGFFEGQPIIHGIINTLLFNIITWLQEQFPTLMANGVEMISNFANGILEGLPLAIQQFGMILRQIFLAIFEAMPTIMENGYELIKNLALGIWNNLPRVVLAITDVLESLLDMIMAHLPELVRKGMEIIGSLATGIWNNLPEIITNISRLLVMVIQRIGGYLPEFLRMGLKLIGEMALGIVNAVPGLLGKIPGIIRSLIAAFSRVRSEFRKIGSNMIRGLWDGIDSVRAWIGSKINGFMNGIVGSVQKFFGIKSPSRLFADEIGKWIPEGLAEGIEDNVKPVTDAMNDLTDLTTGTMTSELAMTGSMSMSNSAVAREDTTLGRLEQLFDNLTNQQQVIILDTGELVGATYPQYDRVGGSQTQLTERWGR